MCPLCQCRYQLPDELRDRKAFCNKCGSDFKPASEYDDKQKNNRQITPSLREKVDKINQNDSYLLFGKLAVKYKFVSAEQLQEALSIQKKRKRSGQNLFLGEIMGLLGMISQSQLGFLLLLQKMLETKKLDCRFGEIAVKNAFATNEEVDNALKKQKKIFRKTKTVKLIGDILVDSGVSTVEQRDVILFKQNRLVKNIFNKK